ncbi:hypothetical protein [Haliangium sp.]|uniref:hypothetical protein n=1 Tax=Haliangium sp. TaxID=2663208 RepID=UPI003D0AF0BF
MTARPRPLALALSLALAGVGLAAGCRDAPPKSSPRKSPAGTPGSTPGGSPGATAKTPVDPGAAQDKAAPAVEISVPPDPGPPPAPPAPTRSFTCAEATVIGGDGRAPSSREAPADGARLPESPPFPWRGVSAGEDALYVTSGYELRRVVDAGGAPVLHRVAGENQAQTGAVRFRAGVPCAEARFSGLGKPALLSDGSVVVPDISSNAVVRVVHPDDAERCYVHYVSGTSDDMAQRSDENRPPKQIPAEGLVGTRFPNPGNGDGDYRQARHNQPTLTAVIRDRIYVLEHDYQHRSGRLLRRIELAPDSGRARAVTTVARFDDVDSAFGLSALGPRVYVAVVEDDHGVVYELDPDTGARREVIRGDKAAWSSPKHRPLLLAGLSPCGGFLCTWAGHRVFAVNPRSGALIAIAGAGNKSERGGDFTTFTSSYELRAATPALAAELPLHSGAAATRGFLVGLAYDDDDDELWLSAETRRSPYLVRITGCAPAR